MKDALLSALGIVPGGCAGTHTTFFANVRNFCEHGGVRWDSGSCFTPKTFEEATSLLQLLSKRAYRMTRAETRAKSPEELSEAIVGAHAVLTDHGVGDIDESLYDRLRTMFARRQSNPQSRKALQWGRISRP